MYMVQTGDRTLKSLTRLRSRCRLSRGSLVIAISLGVLGVVVAGAAPSGASVVTWSGQLVIQQQPPPLVSKATLQSDKHFNFFTERSNEILPSQLPVDLAPNGTFPLAATGVSPPTPGTVASGTAVDSYFLFSNPDITASGLQHYTVNITFSAPILGVIFKTGTLDATSSVVGAVGTTYQIGPLGGLEDPGDIVELVSASSILVNTTTSDDIDSVRVITAATPSTSPGGVSNPPSPGAIGYTEVASDGGLFDYGAG